MKRSVITHSTKRLKMNCHDEPKDWLTYFNHRLRVEMVKRKLLILILVYILWLIMITVQRLKTKVMIVILTATVPLLDLLTKTE